ncbi:SDR family oxidoreductase [Rubripirellula lacrimiformis]|uniref:SDR family oxidoreductase n=1 Tax=Rubripirellula lacrimiformis TaxID=1930273 RepID=UPI001FE4DDDC|nr:SDR family oxidoreductase [Rubripirellula lacrimiformis]
MHLVHREYYNDPRPLPPVCLFFFGPCGYPTRLFFMVNGNQQYTLMTSGTGLVGQYMIRNAMAAGKRIAVIVRRSKKQTAYERVEAILQRFEAELGRELPRPVCLEGDIVQPNLGLSAGATDWVRNNCARMVHGAAVLKFQGADRAEDPWKTNLGGTKNVLAFCRTTGIRDFHYFSTAYVCGNRTDLVRESDLDVGQDFRNDYERSKFEAEHAVRAAPHLDQLTVYRPAVISGDCQTGYTTSYHGLHTYLRLMSLLVPMVEPDENGVRHTPIRLPMTGQERRNVVPIDWVANVVSRLLDTPEAHGQTYHLTPRIHLTPRKIIDCCCSYFNSDGVEFRGDDNVPGDELNGFERNYFSGVSLYESYNSTDPKFDNSNLLKFTSDLPCPEIDETVIHRYMAFGLADRWGKRRDRGVNSPSPLVDFLRDATVASMRQEPDEACQVQTHAHLGLDILGPGGGQWRVARRHGSARFEVAHGLPCPHTPTIRANANVLAKLTTEQDLCPTEIRRYLSGNACTATVFRDAVDMCRTLFSEVAFA